MEFLSYAFLIGFIIIVFINILISGGNFIGIVSSCFKTNSTKYYWSEVSKANINAKAIYNSFFNVFLAIIIFIVIFPIIFAKNYFVLGKNNVHNIESFDPKSIPNVLQLLKKKLPPKPTLNNYQISPKVFLQLAEGVPLIQILQQVADEMCKHLMINKPIKIFVSSQIEAGRFESINDLCSIYINEDFNDQNLNQKLAILSHEMAHYYLYYHNIKLVDQNKNELLTELCSVFIGFGLIMLDGYSYKKSIDKYHKIGYVNSNIIFETLVQTAYVRRQDPNWIVSNLSFPKNIVARIKLNKLVSEYKIHKKKVAESNTIR